MKNQILFLLLLVAAIQSNASNQAQASLYCKEFFLSEALSKSSLTSPFPAQADAQSLYKYIVQNLNIRIDRLPSALRNSVITFIQDSFENGFYQDPQFVTLLEVKFNFLHHFDYSKDNFSYFRALRYEDSVYYYSNFWEVYEFFTHKAPSNNLRSLPQDLLRNEIFSFFKIPENSLLRRIVDGYSIDRNSLIPILPERFLIQLSNGELDYLADKVNRSLKPFEIPFFLDLLQNHSQSLSTEGFRAILFAPSWGNFRTLSSRIQNPNQLRHTKQYEEIFKLQDNWPVELSRAQFENLRRIADESILNNTYDTPEFLNYFRAKISFELMYARISKLSEYTIEVLKTKPKTSKQYASARAYFEKELKEKFPDIEFSLLVRELDNIFSPHQEVYSELPEHFYIEPTLADDQVQIIYEFYLAHGRFPNPSDSEEVYEAFDAVKRFHRVTRPDYVRAVARLKGKIPNTIMFAIPRLYLGEYRMTLHSERLFSRSEIQDFLSRNPELGSFIPQPKNKIESDLNDLYKFILENGRFPLSKEPTNKPEDFSPITPEEFLYFVIVKKMFSVKSEFKDFPELRFENLAGDPYKSYRDLKPAFFEKLGTLIEKFRESQLGLIRK